MRLPDIVGVELAGKRQPGITATDIVLSITEFLREQKVVSAYLEFYGEGTADLTLGDRATISNMAPEFGATAAMFYIDQMTLDYLRLTGREEQQVQLVECYAKQAGLWADSLKNTDYERVLRFDLSQVRRAMTATDDDGGLWVDTVEAGGVPVPNRPDVDSPPHWRLADIAATERPRHPDVSPFGNDLALIIDRDDSSDVWRVPLAGGRPVRPGPGRTPPRSRGPCWPRVQ